MHTRTWLVVLAVAVLPGNGYCAAPTFDYPPRSGGSESIAENAPIGSPVITLQATDTDGEMLSFTVEEQTPDYPVFTINVNDEIIVPSGLDAESATEYSFRLGVTDGTSSDFTTYTLTITDVNDVAPVFNESTYTRTVVEGAAAGTVITQVFAEDPDFTKQRLTYSIQGPQTIFQIYCSGVITVTGSSVLTPQTLTLIVEASDGLFTGTAQVEVEVSVSPCTARPCSNGGTCIVTSDRSRHCFCLSGYFGDSCETGVIAGAVVGGLVVIVAVAIVSFLLGKRRRPTKQQTQQETRVQHDANTQDVTLSGDRNTVHLYADAEVVMQNTQEGDGRCLTPMDGVMATGDATNATASDDVKYDDATTTGLYMGLMPSETQDDYSVLFQKP